MQFFKFLALLVCVLLNSCYSTICAQNSIGENKVIFIKIIASKPVDFVDGLCNGSNKRWQTTCRRSSIIATQKASLLNENPIMRRWLTVVYSGDENKLINTLQSLSFIECIQQRPGMLIPCSKGIENVITDSVTANKIPWYFTQTHIDYLWKLPKKKNIKVAIVDDGFRLTHKILAGHIWTNPGETAGNNKDDDGNGFTDDVDGWDVSDDDNDVSPPGNRLKDFYHGTLLAGEVALATPHSSDDKFGIYIIPVKCLSDNARLTTLQDGYKGIEYAIKAGADIINCSWSGGNFSQYEKDLLKAAADKNILIIASAGNIPTEQIQYPAGDEHVIGVTGLDSLNKKPHDFTYGSFIGLSAPGVNITGASVYDDSSLAVGTGTSYSAPIVSSVAALLMSCYPQLTAKDIEVVLKNSAIPVDSLNPQYNGKLGAGLVDAEKAARLIDNNLLQETGNIINPKGYLLFNKDRQPKTKTQNWFIHPYGHYRGIRLFMPASSADSKGSVALYHTGISDNNLVKRYDLKQLPDSVFVATDSLWVVLQAEKLQKGFNLNIHFAMQTVDSSCLYCSGIKTFTADSGSFSDGSKGDNYAGRESCQWLIEAPPGKKITIQFTAFDTEPRVDFVYVFDGDNTAARIIGLFSGPNIPPTITSFHNKMLVWFVTNETVNCKGWDAKYYIK